MEAPLGQVAISTPEAPIPVPNSLPAFDPHFIQNQLLEAKSNPPKDKKIVIALTVLCFILSVASLAGTHWSEEESWGGKKKSTTPFL